jgi:multicomponent Na+:H+ antiporter subunit F
LLKRLLGWAIRVNQLTGKGEGEMQTVFLGVAIFISFLVMLSLIRGIFGPEAFNRIVAINVIGTKTVVILALMGMIYRRIEMFVDISLVYALLNFIGTLAVAKYFERKEAVK